MFIGVTESTEAPYKYTIEFKAEDFTNTIAADTTASNGYKYDIELTVHDADKSTLDDKTYTISVYVENIGHNPYFDEESSTDLGTWAIGHPSATTTIMPTLWTDDDPSDTLTFDSASSSKCTIT